MLHDKVRIRKMKILYFHQHFSTPNGSTGTRSYEFSKALIHAGHDVTIICGSYWIADSGLTTKYIQGRRIGNVDGIKVIELELPYSNSDSLIQRSILFMKYSLAGIKIALKFEYDLLFATSTPLTAGIPGIIAKIFRRKSFVFEVRDLWPELPKAMGVIKNPLTLMLLSLLESMSYKYADRCVALAPGIAEGILSKYPNKKVIVIPNGSDEIIDTEAPTENKSDKFVAVFTGAHGQANGLDALLDAARLLMKRGEKNVEFQLIGDGKLKESLMNRAAAEGLVNMKFLDPMPKRTLFKYLTRNADVGLMILANVPAFYRGTSPNKFFDYISLGLPVVNNYPGWIADMITNEYCGFAVAPLSPQELVEALLLLREHPEIRSKMAHNSKKLSKTRFDRAMLSNKFVSFLEMK